MKYLMIFLVLACIAGCNGDEEVITGRIENLNIYSEEIIGDTLWTYRIPAHTEGFLNSDAKQLFLKPCDTSWNEENCVYQKHSFYTEEHDGGKIVMFESNKNLFNYHYKLVLK